MDDELHPRTQDPLEPYQEHKPPVTSPRHQDEDVHLTWEASEYVMHHKSPLWFIGLGAITIGLALVLWLTLQDMLAIIVLLLMAIAVIVYAVRPPHTLQYSISDDDIVVGHREYSYDNFRSFSIVRDGGLYSVTLMPTKRFSPAVSMYFPDDHADEIMELLSRHLPHEEREPDFIDRITRSLRF